MTRPRHLARHRYLPPADQPPIGDRVVGARNGSIVTNVVQPLVRSATWWMRVVSMASARVMAGKVGVRRRASIDVPVPRGPRSSR
jgi:hypothetical protein